MAIIGKNPKQIIDQLRTLSDLDHYQNFLKIIRKTDAYWDEEIIAFLCSYDEVIIRKVDERIYDLEGLLEIIKWR